MLQSIEQQFYVEKNPMIEETFTEIFSKKKKEEDNQKALTEWQDVKFFKH